MPAGASCVVALSLNSTKRVDHSNTRLVTQLDRNPGVYPAIQGLSSGASWGGSLARHFIHLFVCPGSQALMTTTSTPSSMST